MNARLRPGMTIDEVVAAFGKPSTGIGPRTGPSKLRYLSPIGSRTVEKEGYVGFEIGLVDGRVRDWHAYQGTPSYGPTTAPPQFRWVLRFWGIFFVCAVAYGLVRAFKRAISEEQVLLKAYKARDIPIRLLPADFRFITNDTTLQEVIDKAGPYSRLRKHPVDQRFADGYGLAPGPLGTRSIVLVEYDLPYQAAVILMPEYPFQPENRIRAAFYRPPRPDEEI